MDVSSSGGREFGYWAVHKFRNVRDGGIKFEKDFSVTLAFRNFSDPKILHNVRNAGVDRNRARKTIRVRTRVYVCV